MTFPTESTNASANIGTRYVADSSSWPTPDTEHGATDTAQERPAPGLLPAGADSLVTQHQGLQNQELSSSVPPVVVYNSAVWTPTTHATIHSSLSMDNDFEGLPDVPDMNTNQHAAPNTGMSSFNPHQTWADIYGSKIQASTHFNPSSLSPMSPIYPQTFGMLPNAPVLGSGQEVSAGSLETQSQSLEHDCSDHAPADGLTVQPNITPRPSPFPPQVGTPPLDAYDQYMAAHPDDFRSPEYSQYSEEETPKNEHSGQTKTSEPLVVNETCIDQNVPIPGLLTSALPNYGYARSTQGFATDIRSDLRPQMQQNYGYYNPGLRQYPYNQLSGMGQYPSQFNRSMDSSFQMTFPTYGLGQAMPGSHGPHMPALYNGSFSNSTSETQTHTGGLAFPSYGTSARQSAQDTVSGFNPLSNADNTDFTSEAQLEAYLQQQDRNVLANASQFAPEIIRTPAGQTIRPRDSIPSIGHHNRALNSAQHLYGPDFSQNAQPNLRTRVPLSQYFASPSTSQPQNQGGDPRFVGRHANIAPYTGSGPRDYKLPQNSNATTTTDGLHTHHAHPPAQPAAGGTYGLNPMFISPRARNPLLPFKPPVNTQSPPKAAFLSTNRTIQNPPVVRRDPTRRVTDIHTNFNRSKSTPDRSSSLPHPRHLSSQFNGPAKLDAAIDIDEDKMMPSSELSATPSSTSPAPLPSATPSATINAPTSSAVARKLVKSAAHQARARRIKTNRLAEEQQALKKRDEEAEKCEVQRKTRAERAKRRESDKFAVPVPVPKDEDGEGADAKGVDDGKDTADKTAEGGGT